MNERQLVSSEIDHVTICGGMCGTVRRMFSNDHNFFLVAREESYFITQKSGSIDIIYTVHICKFLFALKCRLFEKSA